MKLSFSPDNSWAEWRYRQEYWSTVRILNRHGIKLFYPEAPKKYFAIDIKKHYFYRCSR